MEVKENTISYVYEIEFIPTGKRYIGSRTAKGCHPNEILKTYFTSSKIVNNLIKEYGVESFRVVYIDVLDSDDFGDYSARDAESWLLKEFGVRDDENYLNLSDDNGLTHGMKKYCEFHGVENPMQSPIVQEKLKQKFIKNHGVEHPMQLDYVKRKTKNTWRKNHGVEHPMQSPIVQEKTKNTWRKNHGVEYSFQSPVVKEKIKDTWKKNHGVENPMLSEEVKEKHKDTCMKNHGVEHPMQSPVVKEKRKDTCMKNHGVEHNSKIKLSCPHCEYISNPNFMGRHIKKNHPESLDEYMELKKKGLHIEALRIKN